MNYAEALTVVVAALVPLLLPGVFVVPLGNFRELLINGTRIFAASLVTVVLGTYLAALAGVPGSVVIAASAAVSPLTVWWRRSDFFSIENGWQILSIIAPAVLIFGVFSLPFLFQHDGLPSGDSQKAILWAQQVGQYYMLPDYNMARSLLNRDPVDFSTPGLHTVTALIMDMSAQPLMTVGFFAIATSVVIAWLAATLAAELFNNHWRFALPLLAAFFTLTNVRFLRYLREPGYHFQNVVGEFFLFALIVLGIRLIRRWHNLDALLAAGCSVALALTHQFSTFVALFGLAPIVVALLITHWSNLKYLFRSFRLARISIVFVTLVIVLLLLLLNSPAKPSHLFTASPHLLPLVPSALDYFQIMGVVWLATGVGGLGLMVLARKNHTIHRVQLWAFVGSTIAMMLLSQGPRLFIDIPPVRALFFTVVPLSVAAAYLFTRASMFTQTMYTGQLKGLLLAVLLAAVVVPASAATKTALATSQHSLRTNSTLTAEQQFLADFLADQDGGGNQGILVDDYNRRSASWLVLSGQPMFTRIAADLERQMNEAVQSPTRYDLYLNQLDYEKIFSLGSRPELAVLLDKHGIAWLTGITGSSASAFQHNPLLELTAVADDIVLYSSQPSRNCVAKDRCQWLLRASTLVNDIGDREDTFRHLPASIRTTRLSDPQYDGRRTYRLTTAPLMPLQFNVGDYTQALWDKEGTFYPDTAVELLLEFTERPPELTVVTSTGYTFAVTASQSLVRIPAQDAPIDDNGFITLTIHNPHEQLVGLDLMALGLASVP
jgi:hypothetical protein